MSWGSHSTGMSSSLATTASLPAGAACAAGATDRCLDCPVERDCAYSAVRLYLGRVARRETEWPVRRPRADPTVESVTGSAAHGPYGRCVYAGDNDVVDHQVVGMQFANGATGVFTMTGFTTQRDRETRLFGTRGELHGNGSTITVHDFVTDRTDGRHCRPGIGRLDPDRARLAETSGS